MVKNTALRNNQADAYGAAFDQGGNASPSKIELYEGATLIATIDCDADAFGAAAAGAVALSGTPKTVAATGSCTALPGINKAKLISADGTLVEDNIMVGTADVQKSVTSITRSGSTATATATDHGFATGDKIKMGGIVQPEYNGTFKITVLDDDTFTFEVSGTPATPATGTITAIREAEIVLDNTYVLATQDVTLQSFTWTQPE